MIKIIGINSKNNGIINHLNHNFDNLSTYFFGRSEMNDNDLIYHMEKLLDNYEEVIIRGMTDDTQKVEYNIKFLTLMSNIAGQEGIQNKIKYLDSLYVNDKIINQSNQQNQQNQLNIAEKKLLDEMISNEKTQLEILKKKQELANLISSREKIENDINIKLLQSFESNKQKQNEFINIVANKIIEDDKKNQLLKSTIQTELFEQNELDKSIEPKTEYYVQDQIESDKSMEPKTEYCSRQDICKN